MEMGRINQMFAVAIVAGLFGMATPASGEEADFRDFAAKLGSRVDTWHAGSRVDEPMELRVVYFHAADQDPQADYQDRLQRILFDIRDFLEVEMKRIGFGDNRTVPLELDAEGNLVIHTIRGKDPLLQYNYGTEYGRKIRSEMSEALRGTVDLDREFVLAICGLVDRLGDGSWHFRSPYYGWGGSGHRWGLCFAADCEVLDTLNYAREDESFHYREHLGKYTRTLGGFNRLYIGGLAHELGHGLGLPHNREHPGERRSLGTALMGAGNYTWRNEKVGKKGSFLTMASAIRLISHPLFTQSERARFQPNRVEIEDLSFSPSRTTGEIVVEGKLGAEPPAYAVILETDPEGGSNYDSLPWVGEVSGDGKFSIKVNARKEGEGEFRMTVCHLNGAMPISLRIPYTADSSGILAPGELEGTWTWRKAEAAFLSGRTNEASAMIRRGLEVAEDTKMGERLRHLENLVKGELSPILGTPAEVSGNRLNLSQAEWIDAGVGWGAPARDRYTAARGIRDGVCLLPGGKFHARGLYAHPPSTYRFDLGGTWKTLSALGGLQEGVGSNGSALFVVKGDGKELFRSRKVKDSETVDVTLNVAGVKILELIVESGKENNHGCWAVWGSPLLIRE